MKDHPFISGLVVGIFVFSAIVTAAFLIFPELLYVLREINKLLAGS